MAHEEKMGTGYFADPRLRFHTGAPIVSVISSSPFAPAVDGVRSRGAPAAGLDG